MKSALLVFACSCFVGFLFGQTDFPGCQFDAALTALENENPTLLQRRQQLEKEWQKRLPNSFAEAEVTLPVVVHVVHLDGAENIPDGEIIQGIDYLNQAFRNRSAYDPSVGVDTEINFCLARQTPDGQATTGINRVRNSLTDLDSSVDDVDLKDLSRWDPTCYINIWVVRSICSSSGCGVVGYAYFPTEHGNARDGVVIEAPYFGESPEHAVVLAHELGHYLGLYHTFQAGCVNADCLADGDRVCDTPPDETTARPPCNDPLNSCLTDADDASANNPFRSVANGGAGDQNDPFQNYMDYSKFECYNQFTAGQQERMHFFLNGSRASLLRSQACFDPCPQNAVAAFTPSATTILVGESVTFTNQSTGAASYSWTLDNDVFSTDAEPTLDFNTVGTFTVVLTTSNGQPECFPSSDTVFISVACTAAAGLYATVDALDISLLDLSTNASSINWTITDLGGTPVGNSTLDPWNFTFPTAGWYEVCLAANAPLCVSDTCFSIQIFDESGEHCTNGIDDDGDGWIDLFDADCPEDATSYMAQPEQECNYRPDQGSVSMRLANFLDSGTARLDPSATLLAADIDNDGQVEIIAETIDEFMIFDPVSGAVELHANVPNAGPMAVGDVDGNGTVELFRTSRFAAPYIWSLDAEGNVLWTNNTRLGFFPILGLADFNGDGQTELYGKHAVINAETGDDVLLLPPVDNAIVYSSLAADVFPDQPGLELIFGNDVYALDINNLNDTLGNTYTVTQAPLSIEKGLVSVADMDEDGLLDIIVVDSGQGIANNKRVSIWNPRTGQLMAQYTHPRIAGGGFPFVGDVDGDCRPEIGICYSRALWMFEYDGTPDLKVKYQLRTTDGSGATGITMFDFNQDGKQELAYRDQNEMRILEGATGATLASWPCRSGTLWEAPIIIDLDDDGAAEIAVAGIANGLGGVLVFESDGVAWAPARSVWNQYAYNATNINDDLTIPRFPQTVSNRLDTFCECPAPYNAMQVQATYRTRQGCSLYPAADAQLAIVNAECLPNDTWQLDLEIQNLSAGLALGDSTELRIYDGNPLSGNANLLRSRTLDETVAPEGVSSVLSVQVPAPTNDDYLYAVVATNGLPTVAPLDLTESGIPDCDFSNNMDSLLVATNQNSLFAGPDVTICDNQVVQLTASPGFEHYRWSDGELTASTSVSSPGIYWVEATDLCGNSYFDSLIITVAPVTEAEIIGDTLVCQGDGAELSLSETFQEYRWFPNDLVDCVDCASVTVFPERDTIIEVRVTESLGCFSTDSIQIIVKDSVLQEIDYVLCAGDSVQFDGDWYYEMGEFSLVETAANGCDSTVVIDIRSFELVATPWTTVDCEEQVIVAEIDVTNDVEVEWSNGSQTPTTTYAAADSASVRIVSVSAGCVAERSFELPALPPQINLPAAFADTGLIGSVLPIMLPLDEAEWTISWQPTSYFSCDTCLTTELEFPFAEAVTAEITHRASGCQYTQTISAFWNEAEEINDIYLPNAFSPNGDGINDTWQWFATDRVAAVEEVFIFDRWGNQVYALKSGGAAGWDGTVRNDPANQGVYVFTLVYRTVDDAVIRVNGDVTLLR